MKISQSFLPQRLLIILFLFFGLLSAARAQTVQRVNGQPCVGNNITFAASGAVSYWTISGSNYTLVSGGGSSTSITVRWNSAQSYAGVIAHFSSGGSSSANLSVSSTSTPSVSMTSTATSLCSGQSVSFTATATNGGSSPSYAWFVDGAQVQSSTSRTYTTTTLSAGSHTVYVRLTSNASCLTTTTATSATTTVTVNASQPIPVTVSGSATCANDGQAAFTANLTKDGTETFRWYKNDQLVTTSYYVPTPGVIVLYNAYHGDKIKCEVSRTGGCFTTTTTDPYTHTVNQSQPFTAGISISKIYYCTDEAVTLTATSSHAASSYQWFMNGSAVQGAIESTFSTTVVSLQQMQSIQVRVTSSASCITGSPYTASINAPITVDPSPGVPVISSDITDNTRLHGWGTNTFYVSSANTHSYSWTISNAGNSTISPSGVVGWDSNFIGTATISVTALGCNSKTSSVNIAVVEDIRNLRMNWTTSKSYTYDKDEQKITTGAAKAFFDFRGRGLQSQQQTATGQILATATVRDHYQRPVLQSMPAPTLAADFQYKKDFISTTSGTFQASDLENRSGEQAKDITTKAEATALDITKPGTLGWYYSSNNDLEEYVPESAYPYSRTEYYRDGTGAVKFSAGAGEAYHLGTGRASTSMNFVAVNEMDAYLELRKLFVSDADAWKVPPVISVSRDAEGRAYYSFSDAEGKTLAAAMEGSLHSGRAVKSLVLGEPFYTVSLNNSSPDDGSCLQVNNIDIQGTNIIKVVAMRTGEVLYEGLASGFTSTSYCAIIQAAVPFTASFATKYNSYNETAVYGKQNHVAASYQFYLQKGQSVTTSADATVKSMITDQPVCAASSSYTATETGWFLAEPVDHSTSASIEYDWGFSEMSYNFYDDRGRLLASIAPNGVQEILENPNGFAAYQSPADLPFTTLYKYNYRGDLLSVTEPDAGRTEYIYRRDGKIRFSQNPEQRLRGTYSYTSYDISGRPIESGVYDPKQKPDGASTIADGPVFDRNSTVLLDILDKAGVEGELPYQKDKRSDWLTSFYDLADETELLEEKQQWLAGAVSYTENENSKTWYSYDAEGKVEWIRQNLKIAGDKVATTHYSYDFSGKVTEIAYNKGRADAFYHTYKYDEDQRLKEVEAGRSLTQLIKIATYSYYLHGPLKRVVLADGVQGIDYVYTLQGALKAINHPLYDPGQDGPAKYTETDAFAMTLEYHPGDYISSDINISYLAGGVVNYSGNITSMSWKTRMPDGVSLSTPVEAAYTYTYDHKQQLEEAQWATPDYAASTITKTIGELEHLGKEAGLTYDANGNIQNLSRYTYELNKATTEPGDYAYIAKDYAYQYTTVDGAKPTTNQLKRVEGYASYEYDALGQMVAQLSLDAAKVNTQYLEYDASGKVVAIYGEGLPNSQGVKEAGAVKNAQGIWEYKEKCLRQRYTYDDRGFRVLAENFNLSADGSTALLQKQTLYVNDASGQLLSLYEKYPGENEWKQLEIPLYGSGRLGHYMEEGSLSEDIQQVEGGLSVDSYQGESYRYGLDGSVTLSPGFSFTASQTSTFSTAPVGTAAETNLVVLNFELKDHLGSVRATMEAKYEQGSPGFSRKGEPLVKGFQDYYAWGMANTERSYSPGRYGYQGEYAEDEGETTGYNSFQLRMYDPVIGRWISVDPMREFHSPYVGMGNDPVNLTDPDGGCTDPPCNPEPKAFSLWDSIKSMINLELDFLFSEDKDLIYSQVSDHNPQAGEYLESVNTNRMNIQRLSYIGSTTPYIAFSLGKNSSEGSFISGYGSLMLTKSGVYFTAGPDVTLNLPTIGPPFSVGLHGGVIQGDHSGIPGWGVGFSAGGFYGVEASSSISGINPFQLRDPFQFGQTRSFGFSATNSPLYGGVNAGYTVQLIEF